MRILVGHTLGDQSLRIELVPGLLLIAFGDLGSGRTTLARHLARCWLADLRNRALLDVDRRHEYANIATRRAAAFVGNPPVPTSPPARISKGHPECLTLCDRDDPVDVRSLPIAEGPVIVTAEPGTAAR